MDSDEQLIASCRELIRSDVLTQQQLAAACSVSQGHVSKVLGGKVKLTAKMRAALSAHVAHLQAPDAIEPRLQDLARDLLATVPAERRMHIMHILQSLLTLLRRAP